MKLVLLGDISLSGSLNYDYENNKFRFREVFESIKKEDICFGNLETPLYSEKSINSDKKKKGGIILYSSEESYASVLPELNLSAV